MSNSTELFRQGWQRVELSTPNHGGMTYLQYHNMSKLKTHGNSFHILGKKTLQAESAFQCMTVSK